MGKYVKLLCEDDLRNPNCLARQVAVLEGAANSRALLAICDRIVINRRDEVVLNRKLRQPAGLNDGSDLIRKSIRSGTNYIGEPAVGLFKQGALFPLAEFDSANPYLLLNRRTLDHGGTQSDSESWPNKILPVVIGSKKPEWAERPHWRRCAAA
jgi:hypothetical protein